MQRLVLCEEESLGEVVSTMFSQIKCTGSSSMVEYSGCVIGGGEKGSEGWECVIFAAKPEEAAMRGTDPWIEQLGVLGGGRLY
ncbi:uncharacterized protein MONOS_14847 [Monocercomonoides exilis]|uniref:uncharacterized protein n=1 Tax=Monocercomonoides exilis TaxID=2049356 RepID=UPI003559EAAE|nr:hypothetical protein MONOS_14847 [Monocercomonoides exilis]|eukprot:MONOS_14847.1-p1 / transcript=MONOS_14847.1 / gene=MONOS_14847 / organism=Monocercomonoides_exilis_PA203 / gene_product=unspecified product / transcript_product=unspecified product / location=Mono_scaffold01085:17193-17498(-) / protein_length=83 / sequence_SO=supercontig / SO=protein_coding / is_pseudo=false